jgi:hypothetical protein
MVRQRIVKKRASPPAAPPPTYFRGWDEERELDGSAGAEMFEEFARRHVRPEFLKKFARDFNRSGISRRYLNPGYTAKTYSRKVTLEELFDCAVPGDVEVEEIAYIPPDGGTWKRGRPRVMIWLFRSDEGPSLLRVRFGGDAFFLLLGHGDIEALRFPAG